MNERTSWIDNVSDWMLVALTPALVIGMIASFTVFVFLLGYDGPYVTRSAVIMFLFVTASVLIARISMEQGKEYAALFAAPLALVMFIATGFSIWGLLCCAGIWWIAHQVTWNCTYMDKADEDRGTGLLQEVGIDRERLVDDEEEDSPSDQEESPADAGGWIAWWRRQIDKSHRQRTPGITVIYFALLALPGFGVGHWFLPRRLEPTAMSLVLIYAASTLGLLMTTSFLGLRRYLARRRIDMPNEVAWAWLVGGMVLIGLLLFLCSFLPRPATRGTRNPPFSFGSFHFRRWNDLALGNDGKQDDEARRTGTPEPNDSTSQSSSQPQRSTHAGQSQSRGSQAKSDASASHSGRTGSQGNGQNRSQGKGPSKSARNGSGGQESSQGSSKRSPSQDQTGKSGASSKSSSKGGSGSSRKGTGGDRQADARPSGSQRKESQQGKSGQGGSQQGERTFRPGAENRNLQGEQQKSEPQRGAGKSGQRQPWEGEQQPGSQRAAPKAARRTPGPQDKASSAPQQSDSPSRRQPASSPRTTSEPNRATRPTPAISTIGSWFTGLVRLLFYLALAIGAAYLIWRFRDELLKGLRQLWADWLAFWDRLWRRSPKEESSSSDEPRPVEPAVVRQPFAAYANPFRSDRARQWDSEELVRYTFEAVEAWSAERGRERSPDTTPLEHVRELGEAYPALRRELRRLGKLYGQVAYAPGTITRQEALALDHLWQRLESTPRETNAAVQEV